MITRLTAEITPINCATLGSVVFPIKIPNNNEPCHKAEITLLKSKDKENLYNSVQIDVYGCKLSIENNHIIEAPDNINNIRARTNLEVFLTILGFCLDYSISTESHGVTALPISINWLSETQDEEKQLKELPKIVTRKISCGAIITSNSTTTNEDISNYYNLLDPISFYMTAEKAVSPILKIREYLRIFEFFNEKYGNPNSSKKDKEKISRDIIKKFTDKDISANTIENWWEIDGRCSHGRMAVKRQKKRKRSEIDSEYSQEKKNFITPLDSNGLVEVNKAIKEIRPIARLLIEKIALNETRI